MYWAIERHWEYVIKLSTSWTSLYNYRRGDYASVTLKTCMLDDYTKTDWHVDFIRFTIIFFGILVENLTASNYIFKNYNNLLAVVISSS